MPYVKEEYRQSLDRDIHELVAVLKATQDTHLDGCLNYVITRLADELYGGGGYYVYNRLIGVLESTKQEFYRRKVAPYEDKKCSENGDVYKETK